MVTCSGGPACSCSASLPWVVEQLLPNRPWPAQPEGPMANPGGHAARKVPSLLGRLRSSKPIARALVWFDSSCSSSSGEGVRQGNAAAALLRHMGGMAMGDTLCTSRTRSAKAGSSGGVGSAQASGCGQSRQAGTEPTTANTQASRASNWSHFREKNCALKLRTRSLCRCHVMIIDALSHQPCSTMKHARCDSCPCRGSQTASSSMQCMPCMMVNPSPLPA